MKRVAIAITWLAAVSTAHAGSLLTAAPYNVFMLGNFTDYGSDTQGGLAAAGTINISAFQVGQNLSSSSAFFTLVAGTNLIASNGSVNGRVYAPDADEIAQPGFTIKPGNLTTGDSGPIDFANAAKEINAISDGLAAMPASSGNSCKLEYSTYKCAATQHGVNIIDIPDTTYLALGYTPDITSTYADATIILNIGGSTASLTNSGWFLHNISSSQVLLNFYDATKLTFWGSVPVSVLAPNANVSSVWGGALNGNFIANSFTGQYQFNNGGLFTGDIPDFSSAPEPVTMALTGGALLGIVALVRRRRKA